MDTQKIHKDTQIEKKDTQKIHKNAILGKKEKSEICEFCAKTFNTRKSMLRHIRLYCKEKKTCKIQLNNSINNFVFFLVKHS